VITEIKVPKLDANAEEVTVTGWLKQEGGAVGKGDPVVELTTDKASFELEAPAGGILRKILAKEKSMVPVGYILGLVGDPGEPLPDVSAFNRELLEKHKPAKAIKPQAKPVTQALASGGEIKATPAARRFAKEKGLDLAKVKADTRAETITEEVLQKYLTRPLTAANAPKG
jgi:pyruvate/2-oxoglutarate dehydrogenase complex dihydrolipoamide acyltransferase (E2) component